MHKKLSWLMVHKTRSESVVVDAQSSERRRAEILEGKALIHSYLTHQVTSGDLDVPRHNIRCMK